MGAVSTWNDEELPVLEAVYAAEAANERPDADDLVARTGLGLDVVTRAVRGLVQAGYLDGIESQSLADLFPQYYALVILERGRRAVGQWPPDAGEAFLIGLNRLIAVEQDPDQRTRLAKLRDAAADVGKQVLAGAIVAAGQAQL